MTKSSCKFSFQHDGGIAKGKFVGLWGQLNVRLFGEEVHTLSVMSQLNGTLTKGWEGVMVHSAPCEPHQVVTTKAPDVLRILTEFLHGLPEGAREQVMTFAAAYWKRIGIL